MATIIQDLPKEILDYFGSEGVQTTIGEINQWAEIYTPSIVAASIYDLITKTIPAHDFIQELAKSLNISQKRAAAIAKEIKETILETERDNLFRWGVNISDINVLNASPLEKLFPKEEAKLPAEKTISLENLASSKSAPESVTIEPSFVPPKEGTPLILHEEKALAEEKKSSFGGLSFPGFFKSKKTETETSTPVRVKIETPGGPANSAALPIKKKEEKKVVHYSEFRTPLSPFGNNDEFINLENFSKKEEVAKPAPIQMSVEPPKPNPLATKIEMSLPQGEPKQKIETTPQPLKKGSESEKKFFWFSKNKNKTEPEKTPATPPAPNANQPKVEGNIVDLSSNG